MEKTLTEIFNEEGGDKGNYFCHVGTDVNISHNYTAVYEKYFEPYRKEELNFLEIGIWCEYFPGASIRAWNRYFENCNYFGIDIVDCTNQNTDKITNFVVDQKNEQQLQELITKIPKLKFIIDDGCHQEDAIIKSLGNLFPHLESGGIYFIEDLHVVNKTDLYKLVNKRFESRYLSQDKIDYINNNIDVCVFESNDKMCIIKKK